MQNFIFKFLIGDTKAAPIDDGVACNDGNQDECHSFEPINVHFHFSIHLSMPEIKSFLLNFEYVNSIDMLYPLFVN